MIMIQTRAARSYTMPEWSRSMGGSKWSIDVYTTNAPGCSIGVSDIRLYHLVEIDIVGKMAT